MNKLKQNIRVRSKIVLRFIKKMPSAQRYSLLSSFAVGVTLTLAGQAIISTSKNKKRAPASVVGSAEKTVEKKKRKIPVIVEKLEKRSIEKFFNTYANFLPWKEVTVNPNTRITVKEVKVEYGQKVKKGQILAIVDSKVNKLRKQLEKMELDLKQKDFNTVLSLAKKDFISKNEFRQKQMEIKAQKLRAQISALENDMDYIRSPISGVVSEIKIKEGDYIDNPSKYFIKIVDVSSFKIDLHLPQAIASKLQIGDFVDLTRETSSADDDQSGVAEISAISPIVDPKSGTVFVELAIKDVIPEWKVGMYVQLKFTLESRKDIIAIPNKSIVYEKNKPFIYRVIASEKGIEKAEKVSPELGITDGSYTEIIAGSELDDDIIIEGQGGLTNMALIKVVE